jgi:hypothetical protein
MAPFNLTDADSFEAWATALFPKREDAETVMAQLAILEA